MNLSKSITRTLDQPRIQDQYVPHSEFIHVRIFQHHSQILNNIFQVFKEMEHFVFSSIFNGSKSIIRLGFEFIFLLLSFISSVQFLIGIITECNIYNL